MAEHIRTTIRNAISEHLKAHASFVGITVFKSRSRPVGMKGSGKFAVEILIPRETTDPQGNRGDDTEYEREIEVQLIGYCSAVSDDEATDVSDGLALKLETAMHDDTTLGGIVTDLWMAGTDFALDSGAYANASFSLVWKIQVTSSLNAMNSNGQEP